jgi:hypothetical protein
MNLIEAIKSGKPYREVGVGPGGWWTPHKIPNYSFSCSQVLAKWEVKEEPRVVWINIYPDDYRAYRSKEEADAYAAVHRVACRKFIEVVED